MSLNVSQNFLMKKNQLNRLKTVLNLISHDRRQGLVLPLSCTNPRVSFTRTLASKSYLRKKDPDEIENMPIFQYAPEVSKKTKRIYLWGNAAYGNLGNPNFIKPPSGKRLVKHMNRPYKLPFSATHQVTDVACGLNFTVISATNSDNDFEVFGFGLNTDSQIGFHEVRRGYPLHVLAAPVPIQIPLNDRKTKVKRVACGRAHTMILTDKEGVFSLGNNAFGQCGRPIIEEETYLGSNVIHNIQGIDGNVVDVVCGQDHTVFLTEDGKVYACGWGADGQTGHRVPGQGDYKSNGQPQLVKGDIVGEKIVSVSGAADCTLALSDKGDVFGWGNSEYGQLNFNQNNSQPQFNVSHHLALPHMVGKVKSVAAGGTMCGVVNRKGQVFVWGYGILGQGPKVDHLSEPTLLPEPLFGRNELNPDVIVERINCGLNCYAAITNKGDLYMWGRNRQVALGLGHENNQFFPFRVCVPAKVIKVSCGIEHTATLCETFA